MVTSIRRSFCTTPASLLRTKLRNFRRVSVWPCLLGAGVVGWQLPGLAGGFWSTATLCALALCGLSLAVCYFSSYHPLRSQLLNLDVDFQPTQILVQPVGQATAEVKDWRWIVAVDESPDYFYLLTRRLPRRSLNIPKVALSPEETATLRTWLAQVNG